MNINTIFKNDKMNSQTLSVTEQKSLHNGQEIFELINRKILEAEKSILIAAAWFTDIEIFNALVQKFNENPSIEIKIILDDNKDNYVIPFNDLAHMGAKIRVIKKESAFGKMHDKFSIFDSKQLITGSYNWSKNARMNNEENIIYTEIEQTVKEYLDKFNQLEEKSVNFDPNNLNKISDNVVPELKVESADEVIAEYKAQLDELIYAQVHNYDDKKLQQVGRERSENCQGNSPNLENELDTVYTDFLRDIQLSSEKKEIIKSSLKEQFTRSKSQLELKLQHDHELIAHESSIYHQNSDEQISLLREDNISLETTITSIEENKIKRVEEQIEGTYTEIEKINSDHFRPKLALYKFIPNLVLLALVLAYVVLFYSSAAYILIYSGDDAKKAQLAGSVVASPEIFDGSAIPKAIEKGGVGVFFILLVRIFILGLLFAINVSVKTTWIKYTLLLFAILAIDVFVAYKVAESIHNAEYLAGRISEQWSFAMMFSNSDFYLVLIFGLFALLTLEGLMKIILETLDERNGDIKYLLSKEAIKTIERKAEEFKESKSMFLEDLSNSKAKIEQNILNIEKFSSQKNEYKISAERKKNHLTAKCEHQKGMFENITNIHLTKIDNENFTFSTIYIQDRISTFVRGWKDYLHSFFSNGLAIKHSLEADAQVKQWKSNNLKKANHS